MSGDPATLVELRVLEGPNAFFPRPAVKLVLDVTSLVDAPGSSLQSLGGRPGPVRSLQRRRWAARLAARLVRQVALAAGTGRLAVRSRPAHEVERLIVAFPWRSRGRAEALGRGVAQLLASLPRRVDEYAELLAAAAAEVRAAPQGERASVRRPRVPTVAVTGTNGKTTTTRLIAHIGRSAGLKVAWTSTDGVYVDGVAVERGDWSGPGGAARALAEPGLGLAVLETARGGILLRGMAVTGVDVGVVTNVAADHLGLQDVHTVDELAEVKAVVARAVRPGGFVVLNGDDPRVLAMRAVSKGTPLVFSLDPSSPSLRAALDEGGRGTTLADGALCVVERRGELDPVIPVAEVPVTLSGLSSHNTANALAALAACLGLGLPRTAIVEGLRSFVPDVALNPGRMNIWDVGGVAVVVDLAHNEDGLRALLEVANGLRLPGATVRLVAGTAGDRSDEVLRGIGHIAVHGAEEVVVADKVKYLRDRAATELHELISAGAGRSLDRFPDERSALTVLVARSAPGDVVALMCHEQLDELGAVLEGIGGRPMTADQVAERVRGARP